jgi:ankyrin repeat protein
VDPLSGRSALHEACKHGHGGMARVLLKEGERALATQDKEGKTPLHWVRQLIV